MDKQHIHSKSELLLYSLGLGPVFTTLLLYYFFLFIPHQSVIVYILLIASVYSIIGTIGRKSIKPLYRDLTHNIREIYYKFNESRFSRVEYTCLIAVLIVPLILYLYAYLTKIIHQPLIGYDILSYGIMGRMLFEEKSLDPVWVKNFSGIRYIYGILHAPSFSLLLTWEECINSILTIRSDSYFKSVSIYYGLLILGVQYYWVSKKNRWLALVAMVCLLSSYGFFIKFILPHLDTYRIYFYTISIICFAYAIKNEDTLSLFLLGVFSGFAAFSHRIGLVLAVINCMGLCIFLNTSLKNRLMKTVFVVIIILMFGADHYIFDLIWGRGAWFQLK